MGSCVNALRIVTFLFNFAFWLSGIVVFALGLWLLFDPAASDFFALHSTHPGAFRYVGWFLLGAGVIIILVGYFGCIGAWRMNQCALALFCCILIVAFFLELAAAVTLFHKQEHIKHYLESSMYDTIRNRYSSEAAFKTAFDTVQEEFECCGVKTYSDWLSARWDAEPSTQLEVNEEDAGRIEHGIGAFGGNKASGYGRVPSSCCNEHGKLSYPNNCGRTFNQAPLNTYAQFINTQGCAEAVYDRLSSNLDWIVGTCVVLSILQLVGVVLSMTLCCCTNNSKK